MNRETETLTAELIAAIDRYNAAGACWNFSQAEIAKVAIRRWNSFSRRHNKAKQVTSDSRVLDLAKGLAIHFEPDIPYTHPSEWRSLAGILAEVLLATSS